MANVRFTTEKSPGVSRNCFPGISLCYLTLAFLIEHVAGSSGNFFHEIRCFHKIFLFVFHMEICTAFFYHSYLTTGRRKRTDGRKQISAEKSKGKSCKNSSHLRKYTNEIKSAKKLAKSINLW